MPDIYRTHNPEYDYNRSIAVYHAELIAFSPLFIEKYDADDLMKFKVLNTYKGDALEYVYVKHEEELCLGKKSNMEKGTVVYLFMNRTYRTSIVDPSSLHPYKTTRLSVVSYGGSTYRFSEKIEIAIKNKLEMLSTSQ